MLYEVITSEQTLGACLNLLEDHGRLFTATKVWTPTRWLGIRQIARYPSILTALSPHHGMRFLVHHGWIGLSYNFV